MASPTISTPVKSRKGKTAKYLGGDSASMPLYHRSESSLSANMLAEGSITASSLPVALDPSSFFRNAWNKWQRRLPCLTRLQQTFLRVPPRFRWTFVFFWFCWKISLGFIMFVLFLNSREQLLGETSVASAGLSIITGTDPFSQTRVLYVVTTLAEFNTGRRATTKGQDRLAEVLLPIMVDSVESMIQAPFYYQVDIALICGYTLQPEREARIRDALPYGVGLQIWDNAVPLGYEKSKDEHKLLTNTRALARQHRYVVRDKLPYYDLFLAFEDDIRITGHHIQQYLALSDELDRLRVEATVDLPDIPENLKDYNKTKYHGAMTQGQLARVIPGFIRVEVLLSEEGHGAQKQVLPIDRDFEFDGEEHHIDPRICCHVHMEPNIETPEQPELGDVVVWETNIKAFSVRQFPKLASHSDSQLLDWAVLMLGPGKRQDPKEKIGGYWSGREGAFGDITRPSGGDPDLIAQQGGWMLTSDQIMRLNDGLCMGRILPPFEKPTYPDDGQNPMNVEFWSGSYQLFTGVKGGCNLQRIISLDPGHFSKHLIYHVANNKQRQLTSERMLRADHLFGQLNTVQKMAERQKAKEGQAR